jgi:hypothetical protein
MLIRSTLWFMGHLIAYYGEPNIEALQGVESPDYRGSGVDTSWKGTVLRLIREENGKDSKTGTKAAILEFKK